MSTNDRGELGRTRLCRSCGMRCTKERDFFAESKQPTERAKHLARTTCTFCISQMADEGDVTVEAGTVTIHRVRCRKCGQQRTPEEMTNLYWCKKCHAEYQRRWAANKERKR